LFKILLNSLALVFNSCFKAARELHMAFLKPLENLVDFFSGGFRKAIFGSHAALEQLFVGSHSAFKKSLTICSRHDMIVIPRNFFYVMLNMNYLHFSLIAALLNIFIFQFLPNIVAGLLQFDRQSSEN
jgi:hypothetical protein